MKKKYKYIIIFCIILTVLAQNTMAFNPYNGYVYDEFSRAIPSQVGYTPIQSVYSDASSSIKFTGISDMFIDEFGKIYLIDGVNKRLIIMTTQYVIIKIIDKLINIDGSQYVLNKPQGLFVKGNYIYIADTENQKILISDFDGNIVKIIGKPTSEIYPQVNEFKPKKILVDSVGNIYTIISGIFQGAAMFNKKGDFIEFFGSNKVEVSASVLSDYVWKSFLSNSMKKNIARYVPTEFTGFDIDKENIIYTCTSGTSTSTGELRKLNLVGNNLWPLNSFGDLEVNYKKGAIIDTYFYDVEINKDGFLYALDFTRKKIFMYDNEGNLVFIFGAKGNQLGTFLEPTLIESYQDKVYIYDYTKSSITEFVLTDYGKKVYDSIIMFNDGKYLEAKKNWEDVLRNNSNNYIAYIGIGKALFLTNDYKQAIKYFKLGKAKEQESKAFEKYRSSIIRKNFASIMLIIIIFILIIAFMINIKRIKGFYKRKD